MKRFETTVGERIASAMQELSPSGRRVARKLLSEYPVAGLDTVASLAIGAGVSGPTVFRFVKALGFESFRDFQSALRSEVGARHESNLSQTVRTVTEGQEETRSALHEVREAQVRGIEHTYAMVRDTEIEHVAELLANRKRKILTFGGAFSNILATHLLTQLSPMRPGIQTLPSNTVAAAAILEDLGRMDVAVIFDFRRYDAVSEKRARIARDHGAIVILVTDRWLSPVAASADHVLTVDVVASGPSDTLVPALALLEAVCELVTNSLGRSAVDRLGRVDPIRVALQAQN
ncbi:MAG: MurR/RpiR family transcriptional regulator [Micrococcaceae bacterium]|nr:MurR/RpiR family transcriptional regulator [Micrococcaceae bacterium]